MTVIKPNISEAPATTYNASAVPDRTDDFAGRSDAMGTGELTGMNVTAAASLTLTIAAGTVSVLGTSYTYAGGTVAVTTNAGLLDRRDVLIYRAGTGIVLLQGATASYTPGAALWSTGSVGNPPVKPDVVEATDLVLAEIYMPYNATIVDVTPNTASGYVIDKSNTLYRYVDNVVTKTAVVCGTTGALPANTATSTTLTGPVAALSIDGYAPLLGDRVLVKAEAAGANNGIYVLTTLGTVSVAWVLTRSTDASAGAQFTGATVSVLHGVYLGGSSWYCSTTGAITVGTTPIAWTLYGPVLTGDVLTGSTSTTVQLVASVNSQAVIRAGAYQDLAERAGLQGSASVPVGGLASQGSTTGRQGTIDVVIGDSISNGTTSQQGFADWASVLANTENRLNGQPDPGLSWVFPFGNGAQAGFTNVGTMVTGTGINAGIGVPSSAGNQSGVIPASTAVGDGVSPAGAALTWTVGITTGSTLIGTGYSNGMTVAGTGIPAGATVSNPTGSQWLMNQAATATNAALVATFARYFRRVKVYYQTQANGAPITIQPYQAAGATLGAGSGAIATTTAGTPAIGCWDSGDLGTGILGDGITITAGVGTAGAVILGVRYYQTAGTGVTIDNLGIGGVTSATWAAVNSPWTVPNWAMYLQFLAAQGTPARRLYVMVGINDCLYGGTVAMYQANLTLIANWSKAASPLTEVVLVAEHFGDQLDTGVLGTVTALTAGTGTQTLSCTGVTAVLPTSGSTISGPGIPAGCVVTAQATRTVGTSVAVTVTGVATVNTAGAYKISNQRGNNVQPWTGFVNATQTVALATGSAFVNLYERFGDISLQASVTFVTTTLGATVLTATGTNPCSGVLVGHWVYGPGIPNGTKVTAVTSTTVTISQPTIAAATTPVINFVWDRFGVSSLGDGVHFSDYASSMSGTDGQRAIAEHFINKLAYSRNIAKASAVASVAYATTAGTALASNTSTTATLTTQTFTTATAKQLSTTNDVMLYGRVTAAVVWSLNLGPTSTPATTMISIASVSPATLYNVAYRVPAGWYVSVTCATMASLTFTQVTC